MKKRTIVGLAVIAAAVATMLAAPSVASATDEPEYTTVLWLIPDDSKAPNAQDQPFVAQYPAADIEAMGKFMECGKRYQVDVYRPLPDGTKPDVLWAGGFLRPNHDGGFLAYELPYTPYAVITTDECPVVVPEPPVDTPAPVPSVTTPEVPSSPDTSETPSPSTSPTPMPSTYPKPETPGSIAGKPTSGTSVAPPQRTAQTCQQAGPNVKTTDRNLDADGDGIGCETRGVAPVPTPIRTEAKFTG